MAERSWRNVLASSAGDGPCTRAIPSLAGPVARHEPRRRHNRVRGCGYHGSERSSLIRQDLKESIRCESCRDALGATKQVCWAWRTRDLRR